MWKVCISKHAGRIDTNSPEFVAIESFLEENPQPRNASPREFTKNHSQSRNGVETSQV